MLIDDVVAAMDIVETIRTKTLSVTAPTDNDIEINYQTLVLKAKLEAILNEIK
jgi:hypothetical protein